MGVKNLLKIAGAFACICMCIVFFKSDKNKSTEEVVYENIRFFAQALSVVEKKALRNIDMKEFIIEAIKSAISKKTDAHSALIEDSSALSESTSGSFAGIGVSITPKNQDEEAILVTDVLEESPASKAGMQAGDRIISIDDQKLRGMTTDEVVHKMKGRRATHVKIKVLRNKKLVELDIVRDTIVEPSSIGYFLPEHKAFYFHLRIFSEKSIGQLRKLILENAQNDQSCSGVILDLRENPGGILEAAVDIANIFLPRGKLITSTIDSSGKVVGEYKTTSAPIYNPKIPLFVIVNNFTASAAEILAGCLRYYSNAEDDVPLEKRTVPRVFLVGSPTHGKGSVQEVIPIGGGHSIKLTTMLYLLPGKESIQEVGVVPDLEILPKFPAPKEVKMIMSFYGREESLKGHITHSEVEAILSGKDRGCSSEIDKLEGKRRQSMEEKQYKDDDQDLEDQDGQEQGSDKPKKDPEQLRQEALAKNYLIGSCAKMIGILSFLSKNGIILSSRSKTIDFLRVHLLSQEPLKIEKIKQ